MKTMSYEGSAEEGYEDKAREMQTSLTHRRLRKCSAHLAQCLFTWLQVRLVKENSHIWIPYCEHLFQHLHKPALLLAGMTQKHLVRRLGVQALDSGGLLGSGNGPY
jgi:hypothetical protein